MLVEIATAVRRFKSERNLSLGTELSKVQLAIDDSLDPTTVAGLAQMLTAAAPDLLSITRARQVALVEVFDPTAEPIQAASRVKIAVVKD